MPINNKHAYLIIVDKHPNQLRVLLELLDYERNDIFIHIDAKSKMVSSDINTCGLISKVRIYKEINVYWSDISLTEVELFLLKKAREFNHYEYYHLISGSDLPIKSQEEILEFYDSNKGKEFVEYQIPGRFLSKEYYSRVKYYHLFTKHYRHEEIAFDTIYHTFNSTFWIIRPTRKRIQPERRRGYGPKRL